MTPTILSLEEIKARLRARETRFTRVSESTGLTRQTLYNIIEGKTVYSETQETLSSYFTAMDTALDSGSKHEITR